MAMAIEKLNLVGYKMFASFPGQRIARNLAVHAMHSALCARGRAEPANYRLFRHIRRLTTRPVYEVAEWTN